MTAAEVKDTKYDYQVSADEPEYELLVRVLLVVKTMTIYVGR